MTEANATTEANTKQRTSFGYEDLLACARGELFGTGNAQLPLPPLLMFERRRDRPAEQEPPESGPESSRPGLAVRFAGNGNDRGRRCGIQRRFRLDRRRTNRRAVRNRNA